MEITQHMYARVLLRCIGLPEHPRPIFVSADTDPHAVQFAAIFAEEAFRAGAPVCDVAYTDPYVNRARFLHAPKGKEVLFPPHVTQRAQDTVDLNGANVALYGNAELGVYDGIDPQLPNLQRSMFFAARKPFHDRQIRYLSPWLVGAVPTEAWARKLGITVDALWGLIFKVTGIDRDDPIGYLEGTVAALKRRTERLNKLGIRTLHFQGLGTELRVGLSERARWLGGAKQAEDGVWFVANWPTFEVFTTPDWRSVTGHVAITKPCVVSGNVVQGLRLKIEGGEIVALAADAEQNAYERLVATEDSLDTTAPKFRGARRVGEVALVGGSPVAQAATLFYSTLFDENAACHIATGSAYVGALDGASAMSPAELAEIGCNQSDTHHDIMISDSETDVFALCADGRHVQVIEGGQWTPEFA